MKKLMALILALVILTPSGTVYAAYKDVPENAVYHAAVERVTTLGLMDNSESNTFKPQDPTTREQFAKLTVIAAGLSDAAETMKGSAAFPDVPANGDYNGYINVSLSKGYMSGLADGRFHPEAPVTFAQAVTAMIRVLGYTDADISGVWPKNYIEKAKALGLTGSLSPGVNSEVPRWAMAQMLDVLLDTRVKTANAQDVAKTLAEASGLTVSTMYSVFSRPEVYQKTVLVNSKLGSVDFSGNPSIVRNSADNSTSPVTVINGEAIDLSEIKDFNIVYQVSDKSGKNKYILVIDNKITGTLTGILPNKYAPQQIEVDGRVYSLDRYFNTGKLSGAGSFSLSDGVTLLLGCDGKVVDMQEALYSDNLSFAFVMNYASFISNDAANYGFRKYTVKLLMSNGSVNTFDVSADPSPLKGKLVIFTKNSDGSVSLKDINYSTPGEIYIDKTNRKILSNNNNYSNDIAGNVKIFNFISNEAEVDAQASVMSWADLPSGVLQSGKVLFMNTTGSFEDVNFILLNNVTAKNYKLGIIKAYRNLSTEDKPSYSFTLTIEGRDYTYNTASNISGTGVGSVVKVNLQGNAVNNIMQAIFPDTQSTVIQAVDSGRMRVNSRTYEFADNKLIYLLDGAGNVKTIETSQLRTDALYTQIEVYTDIDYISGGKAELIVVKSY